MAKVTIVLDIPKTSISQLNDITQESSNTQGVVRKLSGLMVKIASGSFDGNLNVTVNQSNTATLSTDKFVNLLSQGYAAGDVVKFSSIGNSVGLLANTDYYVRNPEQDRFNVSATDGVVAVTGITNKKITKNAHGLVNGDIIQFADIGTLTNVSLLKNYYVVNKSTNDFEISLIPSGSSIVFTGPVVEAESDIANEKILLVDHGLSDGEIIRFTDVGTVTGINLLTDYYVVNKTADDFEVALTAGGASVLLGGVDSVVKYGVNTEIAYDKLMNVTTGGTLTINPTTYKNGSNSTNLDYTF